MDAREVEAWLASRAIREEDIEPDEAVERRPMTDLEWRKLKTLASRCTLMAGGNDKRFIYNLVAMPYDHPITRRQASFIEGLWNKYKNQHHYNLVEPRWVYDMHRAWREARDAQTLFYYSDVCLAASGGKSHLPIEDEDMPGTVRFQWEEGIVF